MTKKERLKKIFPILEEKFGSPKAALEFETPYQLMIAVILSAQCTDARVNIVTKDFLYSQGEANWIAKKISEFSKNKISVNNKLLIDNSKKVEQNKEKFSKHVR